MKPLENVARAGDKKEIELGNDLLAKGVMGAILLAGGMGTRLGFPHPKGMFPILPGVSLFEIFAKKTAEASLKAGRALYLAIMTSQENDEETQAFFRTHHFFGLDEDQLFFFKQSSLPMEDDAGHPLGVEAADGNGAVFECFVKSGFAQKWKKAGVRVVNIILVDNVLAEPFDANLLGFHASHQVEVSVKCAARDGAEEKVGLLVEEEGRVEVVEYSEVGDEEKYAQLSDGRWKYSWANLSLFCMEMTFMESLAKKEFPLHRAQKSLSKEAGSPKGWKKEKFIFDLLKFAKKVGVIAYSRESCFAPLKNREGRDSPDTVRAILKGKSS